jgi:hypothetical protein
VSRFDGRRGLGAFWQASSHRLLGQTDLRCKGGLHIPRRLW